MDVENGVEVGVAEWAWTWQNCGRESNAYENAAGESAPAGT
jgi:hypothetical protein